MKARNNIAYYEKYKYHKRSLMRQLDNRILDAGQWFIERHGTCYLNNNGSPDYLANIQREEVALNQTVKDIVFGQMWCEGGYLGGGGSGTLDGTGLIDNCKLYVE